MVRSTRLAATALLGLILIAPASAQQAPTAADIAAKLREIGRVVAPGPTASLYAPLQEKEPYASVLIERDVKYGAAELNRLDVFAPAARSASPRPVLVFVRGGAFVGGDKRAPGSPFYDNIMLWAVKNGFVGVNINYRLALQSPWPAGAQDVGAALKWVRENIGVHGGDAARIFLMGHSAGAVHVATYVAQPQFQAIAGGGIKGAVIVSGIYDLTAGPVSDPEKAYFGTDAALYADRSSLQGLLKTPVPIMIAAAELDPPNFIRQFELLKDARCKAESGCIRAVLLSGHSHMSEVYAINTAERQLTDQILEFFRSGR